MPAFLSQYVGRIFVNRDFINLRLSLEKLGSAGEEFIASVTPSFETKNIRDHKFRRAFLKFKQKLIKFIKKLKKTISKLKRKIISLLPDKLLGASRQVSTTVSGRVFKPLKKWLEKVFEPIMQAFYASKIGQMFKNPELKKQRKLALFFVGMLIILIPVAYLVLKNPKETAAWFNEDWLYRREILVTNNTGSETDVVIAFDGANTIDTSDTDKFNSDCSDIRFVAENGELLPHYIKSGCGTTSTVVHVYFRSFQADSQNIYMYYGNKNANYISNNESFLIPKGDGSDGVVTFTGDTNINTASTISGRSCADGGDAVNYSVDELGKKWAKLTSTPSSGCLSSGDTVLLINLQGTDDTEESWDNVGNYELLEVASTSADTVYFVFEKAHDYGVRGDNDEDIGVSTSEQRVMLQRVPQYGNVTVNTGVRVYADAWDGTDGGVLAFLSNGTVTVNGTIDMNENGYRTQTGNEEGGDGPASADSGGDGAHGTTIGIRDGYDGVFGGGGGAGANSSGGVGVGGSGSTTLGGGGGGGGRTGGWDYNQPYAGCGGGGGYGSAGDGGEGGYNGEDGGTNTSGNGGHSLYTDTSGRGGGGGGGGTFGWADLSKMYMGASGGAGGYAGGNEALAGGDGGGAGGIIYILADTITVNGEISSAGEDGTDGDCYDKTDGKIGYSGGGGGGSGGSIYLGADTVTLGTSLVSTSGGTYGSYNGAGCYTPFTWDGGAGGTGRVHVDYADSVSGTTANAAYNDAERTSEGEDYTIGSLGSEEYGPGPVLYWKLNEATGTTANDESSMNNDGTITNSSWRSKDLCLIGSCLSMDGSNDYVSVADNNTIDFGGSDSFTIQAWIRHPTQTDGSSDAIISKVSPSVGGGIGTRTNIDDASDFTTNGVGGGYFDSDARQVLRTTDGTLYAILVDTEIVPGGDMEMWASTDGSSWSEKDSSGGQTSSAYVSAAIDSSDIIHIVYRDMGSLPPVIKYVTFDTSDDTFDSSPATLESAQSLSSDNARRPNIALDSSDVPHVTWLFYDQSPGNTDAVRYVNKVGGSWNTTRTIESQSGSANYDYTSITLNEDDIPEVVYIDTNNSYLSTAVGNANNATSFTTHDPDTSVRTDSYPSIGVDSNGDTWISYLDENGATDYISLIHHTDGSGWTTWDVETTNNDAGNDTSMAIDDTDIYIFYEDDNNDILYNSYSASSGWGDEEVIESVGTNEYVKARWSYNNNPSYDTYGIDFIYSDGDDIWWNTLDPSAEIVESETKGYELYMESDGDLVFGIDDDNTGFPEDSVTSTSADFDDGQWHMVTGVKDGVSSIKLYIDGELIDTDSSISAVNSLETNEAFNVGRRTGMNIRNFSGFIDEVKVYPYARSADEVVADYATGKAGQSGTGSAAVFGSKDTFLTRGLIGYWMMEEDSGSALDSSGYIYDLTNNGTTTYVSGKYGGGSEHVAASTQYFNTATTINDVQTVSFWVNPDNTTNYYIQLTSSAYITSSSGTLSATGFTDPTIYVNGVESNTIAADTWSLVTVTTNTAINADTFRIGRVDSNYFDGTFDEVRLYNRALSAAEVSDLYSWSPGPVGEWKLDERTNTTTLNDSSGYENDLTTTNFGNYFGDASDGSLTVTGDTELVVLNKNGSYDGDMVIKQYEDLTINSGYQLTTDQPGRGMFLYVNGDLQVDGTLSMTARGAYADPTVNGGSDSQPVPASGLRYPVLVSGGTDDLSYADFAGVGSSAVNILTTYQTDLNGDVKLYSIPRTGAEGATGCSGSNPGNPGSSGSGGQTGGGGTGGCNSDIAGDGGNGTVFAGGSASGGAYWGTSASADDIAGPGKKGTCYYAWTGGGAGNPGGDVCSYGGGSGVGGEDGNGGLLIVVVKGNVTVGAGGSIQANGKDGGWADDAGGGASGGGSVLLLYGGTYTNNGTVEASGGTGGYDNNYPGGDGGDGSVQTGQIDVATAGQTIDTRKWKVGKHGSSLSLSDVYNTYLSRTDPSDFDFTASDSFTLETWANTSNSGETTYLISKYDDANAGYKLYHHASGNYCFGVDDDATWTPDDEVCTTGENYGDGKWHHVVGVKDGTNNIKIYVDGNLGDTDSTIGATGTLVNTADFLVGINSDEFSGKFVGDVDDIRVYNYARSASQIVEDMNAGHPAPGSPVGSAKLHLKFDEMKGDTAYDSSPEGNHADMGGSGQTCPASGVTTCPKWTLNGKYNSALTFDTTGEYLQITGTPSFNPGLNDFSISAWVKTDGHDVASEILATGNHQYRFGVYAGGAARTVIGNQVDTNTQSYSTTLIDDGEWHHVVGTFDRDGDSTIYVDKVAEDSDNISAYSSQDYQVSTVYVGNKPGAINGWNGQIDDLRVYHSVLTQEQVNLVYNRGAAAVLGATGTDSSGNPVYSASRSYCPPGDATASCGPLAEWKFDESNGEDTTYDSSGNSKHLDLQAVSDSKWTVGKNGSSVEFTGGPEYMSIEDDSDFDFAGSDDFTIEGWFKHDAVSSEKHAIVTKRTESDVDIGDGSDGDVTFSSDTDINTTNTISGRSCSDGGDAVSYAVSSLTSDSATLTSVPSTGCLSMGDRILLINLHGNSSDFTNVGNYEFLEIDNISSSTVYFTTDKTKYYGSGVSDDNDIGEAATNQNVVLQRVPEYEDVTVNSGVKVYASSWDGTSGGIVAFMADGSVDVSGTIDVSEVGYRGGTAPSIGYGGESICEQTAGDGGNTTPSAGTSSTCGGGGGGGTNASTSTASGGSGSASSGGGGGGGGQTAGSGYSAPFAGCGAGGGYGTDGGYGEGGSSTDAADGTAGGTDSSGDGGTSVSPRRGGGGGGGGTYGTPDLSSIFFGTGGGAGGKGGAATGGAGGNGGGIIYVSAKNVDVSGNLYSHGEDGTNGGCYDGGDGRIGYGGGGGGGAGGSIFVAGDDVDLGSSVTKANGGYRGQYKPSGCYIGFTRRVGGNGGEGRIYVDYISSLSATTDPTHDSTQVSGPGRGYAIYMESDGDITFGIDDDDSSFPEDSATSTAATYDDGQWHHFTAVKDGTTSIKLYIDGVLVATDSSLSATGSLATSASLYIGKGVQGTEYWDGGLDDIRIFEYAKTPEQIAWSKNRGKPTGHWKLDECSGSIVHDTSGLNNHGTITIGALGDQTAVGTCESSGAWYNGVSGKKNYSLNFDGSDDYIELNSETFNPGYGDFTLSAWVKTDNNDTNARIFSAGSQWVYEIYAGNGGAVAARSGNQSDAAATSWSTSNIEDGQWHHVLATFDRDGSQTLYIDGRQEDSDSISSYSSQNYNPSTVRIGRYANGDQQYWTGQIDDVKIFPYVLSSQQVISEYRGGAVSFN